MGKIFDACERCISLWPVKTKPGYYICLKDYLEKKKKNFDIQSKMHSKPRFVNIQEPNGCNYKMEQVVMRQNEKDRSM